MIENFFSHMLLYDTFVCEKFSCIYLIAGNQNELVCNLMCWCLVQRCLWGVHATWMGLLLSHFYARAIFMRTRVDNYVYIWAMIIKMLSLFDRKSVSWYIDIARGPHSLMIYWCKINKVCYVQLPNHIFHILHSTRDG